MLVLGIKFDALVVIGACIGGRHLLGGECTVFPPVDDGGQLPRGPAFVIYVCGLHQLFQQAQLVVGIEDREVRFQVDTVARTSNQISFWVDPDQLGMTAQQLHADGVERAQPRHAFNRVPHH